MNKKKINAPLLSIFSFLLLSYNAQATNTVIFPNDDNNVEKVFSVKKAMLKIGLGAGAIGVGSVDIMRKLNLVIPVTTDQCDRDVSSAHPQEIALEWGNNYKFIRSPTNHTYCEYYSVSPVSIGFSQRTAYQGMTGDEYSIRTNAYPMNYLTNMYLGASLVMGGTALVGAGIQDLIYATWGYLTD